MPNDAGLAACFRYCAVPRFAVRFSSSMSATDVERACTFRAEGLRGCGGDSIVAAESTRGRQYGA